MLEFLEPEEKILRLIEAKSQGLHRCLNGRFVKVGTKACQQDIMKRIEDICHHRDDSNYGSDSRVYFSGVLRVLRRKLRENDKIMSSEQPNMQEKSKVRESLDKETLAHSARMMKLSGLI